MARISRDIILSKVNTFDIFSHFLRDRYANEHSQVKQGVHIYVPEISGQQKSPSFNIYYSRRSQEWRYKDFTGNDGSVFDLVMNLYNVSFPDALKIIDQEMNLNIEAVNMEYERVKPKAEYKDKTVNRNYSYNIQYDKWRKKHLEFWSRYGTSQKALEFFNIKPVFRLSAFRKDNSPYEIESGSKQLIYAWEYDGWSKWYMPNIKNVQKKAFGYLGKKPSDFVFGLEQLPETGDDLYLIAGEKDCVNMYSHGFNAVCLDSEASVPMNNTHFMELLKSKRFKRTWIMYDNDQTGRKRMLEISKSIPELVPKLWAIPDDWDISDYLISEYAKYMY